MTLRMLAWTAGVAFAGLVIGVAVAIASSPASLNPDRHTSTGFVAPSPRPVATPSPTVNAPGVLGASPRLITNGSSTVIGLGSNLAMGSSDGGKTWAVLRPPSNGSGLAVDPSNPRHAITGGGTIQITNDGGATWSQTASAPPAGGPYQPLAISATEPNVWFLVHQGKLLRTRDGSATWADVGSLSSLTNPILVSGQSLGQFFLASGTQVFQLSDYGQAVAAKPSLPGSVTDVAVVGGNQPTLFAKAGSRSPFVLLGGSWVASTVDLSGPIAAGADGTLLVGNGGAKLGTGGLLSYSTDSGNTWRRASGLPFDQTVEAIAGQPDTHTFFAYCFGGDVYASSDGGRTWTIASRRLRSGTG